MYNLNDYVSGEKIAALADLQWEPGQPIPDDRDAVIYTHTHHVADLFTAIRPLSSNFVLITHNSDVNVTPELYASKPPNVVLWFAQNVCHKADDLIAVPIGIANSQWPHGNVSDIVATSNVITPHYSFQFCVKIDTNPQERTKWVNFVNQYRSHVICPPYPCDRHTFLTTISQAVCVLSPAGNGVDCHRNYETFLMGRYPVTNYNIGLESLPLPFIFVQDINNETPDSIGEKLQRVVQRPCDYSVLFMPYWAQKIQDARCTLFKRALERASNIVKAWPAWKAKIL